MFQSASCFLTKCKNSTGFKRTFIFSFIFLSTSFAFPGKSAAENFKCYLAKPPATPPELLNNLLCLSLSSTHINHEFFINDSMISQLTAGEEIIRNDANLLKSKNILVKKFPFGLNQRKLSIKNQFPENTEMVISISSTNKPFSWNARIYNAASMALRFEDIEDIFGKSWKIREHNVISEAARFNPPMPKSNDYHANQEIFYKILMEDGEKLGILVSFDPKGICDTIQLEVNKSEDKIFNDAGRISPPEIPKPISK